MTTMGRNADALCAHKRAIVKREHGDYKLIEGIARVLDPDAFAAGYTPEEKAEWGTSGQRMSQAGWDALQIVKVLHDWTEGEDAADAIRECAGETLADTIDAIGRAAPRSLMVRVAEAFDPKAFENAWPQRRVYAREQADKAIKFYFAWLGGGG